jgi:hypothetical protein
MKPVEGQKTKFYTDVKLDIIAGMQFLPKKTGK